MEWEALIVVGISTWQDEAVWECGFGTGRSTENDGLRSYGKAVTGSASL